MKTTSRIAALLIAFGLIQGCATMSQDECLTADWYTIGYEDGTRGRSTQYLTNHRKACAKHGVTPNLEQYTSGHSKGVPLFCVGRRGFTMGSNGNSYPSLCPSNVYPEFEEGFTIGLRVYDLKTEIDGLTSDLDTMEGELRDVKWQIVSNEKTIVVDETTPEIRLQLLGRNKELEMIAQALEADIFDLEGIIEEKQRRLDNIHY